MQDLEKIEHFLGSRAHPAVLQSGGQVAMRKSVFLASKETNSRFADLDRKCCNQCTSNVSVPQM